MNDKNKGSGTLYWNLCQSSEEQNLQLLQSGILSPPADGPIKHTLFKNICLWECKGIS